jgi:hypothetical protein
MARSLSSAPAAYPAAVTSPRHRVHVWPWLRAVGQRLLLPEWLAITLGRHIFTWRQMSPTELEHELEHVRQWRRYGLRFIPRYLRAGRRARRSGGDRYRDNPFEMAARRAAERVRPH